MLAGLVCVVIFLVSVSSNPGTANSTLTPEDTTGGKTESIGVAIQQLRDNLKGLVQRQKEEEEEAKSVPEFLAKRNVVESDLKKAMEDAGDYKLRVEEEKKEEHNEEKKEEHNEEIKEEHNEEMKEEGKDEKKGENNENTKEELRDKVTKERKEIRDSLLGNSTGGSIEDKPGKEISCKVLIMGAGMAGIYAAKTLKDLGMKDVLVIEGTDRIGGRIKEVEFGGISVEVGANWVHFSGMQHGEENPVEDLLNKAKLNFVSDDYSDYIFRYNGENVTEEADLAMESMEKALKGAIKIARRKIEENEPDVNFQVALALQDWRPVTPVEKAAEYYMMDFEFGDEPSDTGLKDNAKVFMSHGKDDMFVADPKGYSELVRLVAQESDQKIGENIILNQFVKQIFYAEEGQHKIKVIAKDTKTGELNTYKAEAAIVTFSVGVLQSSMIKFIPQLPSWKMETLYMFKMIKYIKIFVKFPSNIQAFWDDNHYILYTDPYTRGDYEVFQNLEARGKYFPKGTNMLLVTILGNNWERIQSLSKDQVKAEIFQVLKNMYGDKAVEPEDILIPDWTTNPFFFGAYSNWPIGVERDTYENMDAPVGTLYMAGEACSKHFSGYVHGAIESGEMTARELFSCMKFNQCEKVPMGGYGYGKKSCKK